MVAVGVGRAELDEHGVDGQPAAAISAGSEPMWTGRTSSTPAFVSAAVRPTRAEADELEGVGVLGLEQSGERRADEHPQRRQVVALLDQRLDERRAARPWPDRRRRCRPGG